MQFNGLEVIIVLERILLRKYTVDDKSFFPRQKL